jgi:hypothetical protein
LGFQGKKKTLKKKRKEEEWLSCRYPVACDKMGAIGKVECVCLCETLSVCVCVCVHALQLVGLS